MPVLTRSTYVLAVPDLARSGAWFSRVLGFADRELAPGWRVFERDAVRIMAGECPDALPPSQLGDHAYFAYLTVEGVDAYFAAVEAAVATSGGMIRKQLRTEPWGMREFAIETVDGHRLMIGEELRRA